MVWDGQVGRLELPVQGLTTGQADGPGFASLGGLLAEGAKTAAALAFLRADPKDERARVQPGSKDLGGGAETDRPMTGRPR